MKKITLIFALFMGIFASVDAQKRVTFEDVEYCTGAIFNKVSNNGKYVAGYASSDLGGSNVGFVYLTENDSMICLNPEWEDNIEQSHLVKATAMDVSDAGIVVGQYAFDDMQVRPAFYNIATGEWTELERPANVVGKITEPGSLYGEATSISADGKYIGGYVIAQMDNSTRSKQVRRNVACVWVRTNDDELNPTYELHKPIDEVHTKIMTQGDWAWHMSDNGQWLGGNSSANSGCFNVAIWENNYTDTLERNVLIGKADWDRSEDDNDDGKIDDEDGADAGQYFWNGIVSCISPNGEWIVGYHTFNGTGYNDVEISTPVGFRYNTKTEVLEDTLFAGCPTVVFDDGEMMFTNTNILSSSNDKKVQCGTSVIAVDGLGQLNIPMLLFPEETAIENVKDLNVNLFVNNSTLYVEGEYTSIEVYSVLGALVGTYNTNEINVANMNKGVYVVRIINGNQATTKKINL
ncbi:MAG: T9SS type A sorting domain-containing protein [Paludibacteraceae bacterium]|nr:T9SS type A sorting domain-containing protein [Paludibacteraceae bacterium]